MRTGPAPLGAPGIPGPSWHACARRLRAGGVGAAILIAALVVGGGPGGAAVAPVVSGSTSVPYPAGMATTSIANSIACPSVSSCVAVGWYTTGGTVPAGPFASILTETDGTWTPVTPSGLPDYEMLSSVACTAPGSCVAVGATSSTASGGELTSPVPFVETETSGNWQAATPPLPVGMTTGSLQSVSCAASGSCVAVGGSVVEALSGSSWTASVFPGTDPVVNAVSCPAAGSCTAAGTTGTDPQVPTAFTLAGGSWTTVAIPGRVGYLPTDGISLSGLSCPTLTWCAAVGIAQSMVSPSSIAYVLQNGAWTEQTAYATTDPGLSGVDCPAVGECVAVGGNGVYTPWNGVWWSVPYPTPPGANATPSVNAVSCASALVCTTAGSATQSQPVPGTSFSDTYPAFATVTVPTAGYLAASASGGVFAFGTGQFAGSAGNLVLNAPVVGMAQTGDGGGYWLAAADGGVFAYGDARFQGSMGGRPLNEPIVGMAGTPDGRGYWLVAADGGIFSFGDAGFFGSMGGRPLNAPVVGLAVDPATGGYWEVGGDGSVFAFGAPFSGSLPGLGLHESVIGMAATSDGRGYWMASAVGGVFSFGDAPFEGSMAGRLGGSPLTALVTQQQAVPG
jgi:hypothetical protein